MRLKIFLAPFAFLIAVVVAIWYIWPVAMDIQSKMDEIKISQENLNATLTKKDNVKILTDSLEKNKDKEEFILNFLPSANEEEKIVNGLSYLASGSGVNLLDISIANEKISAAASNQPADRGTSLEMPAVKFAVAGINFSGKYENIKIFLSQIYKMEIINKINLLSIFKATGNDVEGDILSVNMEIKFGYMPYINQTGSNLSPIFSQSSFNFNSYTEINKLIDRKIPVLDVGQKGKINPFLP